jgi:hypothetical protein
MEDFLPFILVKDPKKILVDWGEYQTMFKSHSITNQKRTFIICQRNNQSGTFDHLKKNTLFIPHILYQEIHRLFLRIAPLDTYYKVHWTNV